MFYADLERILMHKVKKERPLFLDVQKPPYLYVT